MGIDGCCEVMLRIQGNDVRDQMKEKGGGSKSRRGCENDAEEEAEEP